MLVSLVSVSFVSAVLLGFCNVLCSKDTKLYNTMGDTDVVSYIEDLLFSTLFHQWTWDSTR